MYRMRMVLCVAIVTGSLLCFNSAELLAAGKGKGKKEKKVKADKKVNKGQAKKIVPDHLSDAEKAEWVDGNPPGWKRGKKKGWGEGDLPPGLAKKSEEDQKKWKEKLKDAKKRAKEKLKERRKEGESDTKTSEAEDESIDVSIDESARAGVPIEKVIDFIEKAIGKNKSTKEIEKVTRAVAYGVKKGSSADELLGLAEKLMKGEISGDDMAVAVHKRVGDTLKKGSAGGL